MPIYEFECGECGNRFERLVDAGTRSATCPSCDVAGAERRFSSFGVATRQLTPRQRRRLEDKRGTDRDGARQRFKQGRSDARKASGGDKGGSG